MTQDDLVSTFLGSFGRGLPGNTYFDDRLEDNLSLQNISWGRRLLLAPYPQWTRPAQQRWPYRFLKKKKKNPLISSGLGLSWMNKPLCLWEKLLCVHPNLCPPSPGQQLDYTFRPSCSWVWIEFWQKNVGGNAICHFQTRTIKTPVCPSTSHTLSSPSAGWRERGQSHNVEGAWDPEQTWRLMSIWGSELIEKYTCDVETKAFESSLF